MLGWQNNYTLGGPSWKGNPPLATTSQLNSTSAYTISVSNYFQNEIDGLLLSTGGTTNQWAQFSSITDVNIANFNIYSTNTIFAKGLSTNAISTSAIYANLITTTSLSTTFMSTNTLQANQIATQSLSTNFMSTNTILAATGDFTGLSATNASFTGLTAGSANITSLTGGASGTNGTFADLTVNNNAVFNNSVTDFKHHVLSNVDLIHSGSNSAVVGCNLTLRATNALLGYGGNIDFEANQGALVAANTVITLKAKNGNRGKIVLDAEPGYAGIQGEINLTATGGTPPSLASLGGRIHLSATNPAPLTSVSPSYVLQTADSILSYAGGLSPISGNYGYNYQQGLNGVNIVAGTVATIPNVPGTVYLYGTNLAGTGNSGGVRVQNGISVDVIYPYPTGFITPDYDLILRGNAAGNKVTLCNVRNIYSDGGNLCNFYIGFISNFAAEYLTVSNVATVSSLTTNVATVSTLNLDQLNLTTTPNFNNLNVYSTAFISSLTVNDVVFVRQREDFITLNVSSLFASTISSGSAYINQLSSSNINLITTPTYSLTQQFRSTTTGNYNSISTATNLILSTSISLTSATLPETPLINGFTMNSANIGYWASTIQVAYPPISGETLLSNTLDSISPNTGLITYKNLSGVPLGIFYLTNVGQSAIVLGQNFTYAFTWNGSYWDVNTSPANIQGTFGTSFSMYQTYNNTVFQSPDILTLDSALVNITGTLGDTDITTATVKTANINQLTSSNITLLNTPSYSIEQQFFSTSGGPFNTISSATNLILSTSMALTATTASENDFIANYNITINNVDYWASTINIYTGSAPNSYNFLTRLFNGVTGQLTYRNNGTGPLRITDYNTELTYVIPPTCNVQFTWAYANGWTANSNPVNVVQTFGTSFSVYQKYNKTILKTPDILELDCASLNILGSLADTTITTANITQLNSYNITLQNTNDFSIEQQFFSTTALGFNSISSVTNQILSTSMTFTTGGQEFQPFIPQYTLNATNEGQWASTVFLCTTSRQGTTNFLANISPLTGGQINYSNVSPRAITLVNQVGGTDFTVPVNCNYQYRWSGTNWTEIQSPAAIPSMTYGTSFSIFQTTRNTTLQTPDTLTLQAGNVNIPATLNINNVVADSGNFISTISTTNLNTTNLNTTNFTTVNLNAATGNITSFTASNINASNVTAVSNLIGRTLFYSNAVGSPPQGSVGITQSATYATSGTSPNFVDTNCNYQVFPNVSSLTNQTMMTNSINYPLLPGGFFTMAPLGIAGPVNLLADGKMTSTGPIANNLWPSSIMRVAGQTAGTSNYLVITVPNVKGSFMTLGTAPAPYGNVQYNLPGFNVQTALIPNQFHRWENTGSGWTCNLNATPYPSTMTTDTCSIVQQPGGIMQLNSRYINFGNNQRIVTYNERTLGTIQIVTPYGKAQVDNIAVQYQGVRFSSNDYNCTVSFSDYGASQVSLATNQVCVNTYTDANGLWLLQLRLTTPTIPGVDRECFWSYQVTLTPRSIASGNNTTASFGEIGPWEAMDIPAMHISSMTASTISMTASNNIIMASGMEIPIVLGEKNISLNANSNIDLVANNYITLEAQTDLFLSANDNIYGNTSSFFISNTYGNSVLGFDGGGTAAIYGISTVAIITDGNIALQSASSNIEASAPLTICNVRQPFIQYGGFTSSGNSGSNVVNIPIPYSTIYSYRAYVTMEDTEPAEMSAQRLTNSNFQVYWAQAGGGSHEVAWMTLGNLDIDNGTGTGTGTDTSTGTGTDTGTGTGTGSSSGSAAYDLINYIVGDSAYPSWTPGGSPDYYTVYYENSADDTSYSFYDSQTVYDSNAGFYSLTTNYWYRYYVRSHYGGSYVDSSNSVQEFCYPI